jgi:hypothetical protein
MHHIQARLNDSLIDMKVYFQKGRHPFEKRAPQDDEAQDVNSIIATKHYAFDFQMRDERHIYAGI